jgi:hypothetical protein
LIAAAQSGIFSRFPDQSASRPGANSLNQFNVMSGEMLRPDPGHTAIGWHRAKQMA